MFAKSAISRAGLALALALPFSTAAALRAQNLNVDVANMRQEIDLLRQRIGQLEVNVDALQRQNSDLRASATDTASQNYATVAQLNKAVASLNQAIKDSKADTLARVKTEMDSLTKQSNAALDSMAAKVNAARRAISASSGGGGAATATPAFSDNYPKDGISYTVVSGDTLDKIARKTGAKSQDIRNANKIANDKALMIGQVLFIPGGRDPNAPAATAPAAPLPASGTATPIAPAR